MKTARGAFVCLVHCVALALAAGAAGAYVMIRSEAGSALPAVMEEIRLQLGRSHESLLANDPEFHDEDHMALIFVLQAAANYLALRANASPNYNGIRLDTEEGWSSVMAMLERVALHSG